MIAIITTTYQCSSTGDRQNFALNNLLTLGPNFVNTRLVTLADGGTAGVAGTEGFRLPVGAAAVRALPARGRQLRHVLL